MATPNLVLDELYMKAESDFTSSITDSKTRKKIDYVCRCSNNRAGVRLLMACLLAKIDNSTLDPRKPYTEIGGDDSFSGRNYDEKYLTPFTIEHRLPCNSTTAFLTPALRNINHPLTTDTEIVGRPKKVYDNTIDLLEKVALNQISAETMLLEIIHDLILLRNERQSRIDSQLDEIKKNIGSLPLCVEEITNLIQQHLACKNASRLPVLIVVAAYRSAQIGEFPKPVLSHHAADRQTGALGDIEICLTNKENVCTSYEMKAKRVTKNDIDLAVKKILIHPEKIDNYIFVSTDEIEETVFDYAASFYKRLNGVEIAVLDCIGFLRHLLHFFYRARTQFLDEYQKLILSEPESAVNHQLKEVFLTLRQAAESGE